MYLEEGEIEVEMLHFTDGFWYLWPPYVIGGPLYFCPVVSFYLLSSSIWKSLFHQNENLVANK